MKRSVFRLLTIFAATIAISTFAVPAMAQGNGKGKGGGGGGGGGDDPPPQVDVGYRLIRPQLPFNHRDTAVRAAVSDIDSSGSLSLLLAVGFYRDTVSPDIERGFIYDHLGYIDPSQPGRYWDITELMGPLPAWLPATFDDVLLYGVNRAGRVAGAFSYSSTDYIPFYFDLADEIPTYTQIPIPEYATGKYGLGQHLRLNESGDILISYSVGTPENPQAGGQNAFIYNPEANGGTGEHIRLLDSDGTPLHFGSRTEIYFNSSRVVIALQENEVATRFPVGGNASEYEVFTDITSVDGINEFNEFAGELLTGARKPSDRYAVFKIDASGSIIWQVSKSIADRPMGLNNSGDVVGGYGGNEPSYLYHEGDPATAGDENLLPLVDLIIDSSDPNREFRDGQRGGMFVLDRDDTDFGAVVGRMYAGQDANGTNYWDFFVLVPESSGQ